MLHGTLCLFFMSLINTKWRNNSNIYIATNIHQRTILFTPPVLSFLLQMLGYLDARRERCAVALQWPTWQSCRWRHLLQNADWALRDVGARRGWAKTFLSIVFFFTILNNTYQYSLLFTTNKYCQYTGMSKIFLYILYECVAFQQLWLLDQSQKLGQFR